MDKPSATAYSEYMRNAIIETVSETADDDLIKYIYTMLMSAINAEMRHREGS